MCIRVDPGAYVQKGVNIDCICQNGDFILWNVNLHQNVLQNILGNEMLKVKRDT